jgi:5-oxoprolinase (ATP-hydrolysing) subunit A
MDDVIYQIGALPARAQAAATTVKYVKPHGALYNTIVHHEVQAHAVVEAHGLLGASPRSWSSTT